MPSITSIDKAIFRNSFLENWKVEQVVLAAAEHPKQPHEDNEAYANRIYQLSLDKPRDAADFGSAIHSAIEAYPKEPGPEILPWFSRYHDWHQQNILEVVASEKIMVDHDIGVAGRCDLICRLKNGKRAVVDYKTQNVKTDKKGVKVPAFYESWPRQLAFYGVCDSKEQGTFPELPTCISLILDSNEPSAPYIKIWDNSEIVFNYKQFLVGAWLWFSGNTKRKAYWPTGRPWSPEFSIPMPT